MSRPTDWLRQGLAAMDARFADKRAEQYREDFGSPPPQRDFSGNVASQSFSATGPAPVRAGQAVSGMQPMGGSTPSDPTHAAMSAQGEYDYGSPSQFQQTQQSVVSSDPAQLAAGGDSMFYNMGRQQPQFSVFGQQAGPGMGMMGGQQGVPGFGGAIQSLGGFGGAIMDGLKGAGGWIMNPENAGTLSALTNAGGLAASIWAAKEQGELEDEERRRREREDERRREFRRTLSPELGAAIRSARGR